MAKTAPVGRVGGESGSPDVVDLHVGARIRLRRRFLGMSQQALAEVLDLTFQQIQKYERGANRVSASKLYEIARALQVEAAFFFEGLPEPAAGRGDGADAAGPVREFLATAEGRELARLFPQLGRPELQRRLLELVRAAAEDLQHRRGPG